MADQPIYEEMSVMQKARKAFELKQKWKITQYSRGKKTIKDIGKELSEHERTVYRLLKLNELIMELQQLIDEGKLSLTKGYFLSELSVEDQTYMLLYHYDLIVSPQRECKELVESYRKKASQ